ncbi:response regulator [Geoalkalibacter subterraneus]|uniref:Response regulatory domain-containing protein n=1 Tax=Geoalkalibacter subterraneus TaxID=483547 RepID=A0A0B5FUL1_9BACT|nr:response regulator [Geoalkalibacter subterraneus]AJF07301.1 hypothetical protein GSUB_13055 [Geoalkalibacter subterraneus]
MKEPARILLIDDQKSVAEVLGALLKCCNATLDYAPDGTKGLQRVKQQRPDLIFLDIMMPGLDGYAVCRYLKEDPATRDIPVVFLSAGQDKDVTRGREAGGDFFIGKPFVSREIVEVFERFVTKAD